MRSTRTACLLVVLGLATAPAVFAYTVVLKNGSTLEATRRYSIRPDGKAVVVLANGTTLLLEIAEVDVKKTEELNRANDDSVVVLDDRRPGAPRNQGPKPTLQDMRARPSEAERAPATRGTPLVVPTRPSESPEGRGSSHRPFANAALAAQLETAFRSHGVDGVRIYQGSDGRRPLIQVSTPNEAGIFSALEVAAQALIALRQASPDTIATLELRLETPGGDRGGEFLITPEQAKDLADGKIDAARFFVKYVQF